MSQFHGEKQTNMSFKSFQKNSILSAFSKTQKKDQMHCLSSLINFPVPLTAADDSICVYIPFIKWVTVKLLPWASRALTQSFHSTLHMSYWICSVNHGSYYYSNSWQDTVIADFGGWGLARSSTHIEYTSLKLILIVQLNIHCIV